MKDNFSTNSDSYAKFRPVYPKEFYDYLKTILPGNEAAWDCGTGNGQVAFELSKFFQDVYATDISQQQLDHAKQGLNIHYSLQPAEKTNFNSGIFDLILVAQAIHWFDFDRFYAEVRRTVKKDALLVVLGYGKLEIDRETDALISSFYENVIGKYWDAERKYIDELYKTIPFPFEEIETPEFINQLNWNLEQLEGYLKTWSAVKHFEKAEGFSPVPELIREISGIWNKDELKKVRFPMLLRIGRVK